MSDPRLSSTLLYSEHSPEWMQPGQPPTHAHSLAIVHAFSIT